MCLLPPSSKLGFPILASLRRLFCTHLFLPILQEPPTQVMNCPHKTQCLAWRRRSVSVQWWAYRFNEQPSAGLTVCLVIHRVKWSTKTHVHLEGVCAVSEICSTQEILRHGATINILLSIFQSLLSYEKRKWPQIEMNVVCRTTMGKLECRSDAGLFTNEWNLFKSFRIG